MLYLAIAGLVASCSSVAGPRDGDDSASIPKFPATTIEGENSGNPNEPFSHAWEYLFSYGDEERGYATYSYVLVGRDNTNQQATFLYYELVKAIQGSTISAETLTEDIPKSKLNVFIIPVASGEDDGQEKPDYELSKLLLASLSISSSLKLSRPGPYIMTLYQPISVASGRTIADVLYVDLTDTHPKALPEIVRTYKENVIEERLDGVERLESFRLSLLNLALLAEDSIGFAKSAYAEMRNAFGQ